MYIGVKQQKKFLVFFVILVVFLILLFLTFWSYGNTKGSFEPQDVVLGNLWEDSVSVSWFTDVKVDGFVFLYENGTRAGKFEGASGGKNFVHHVTISELKPNTIYEFEIYSGGEKFLRDDGSRYIFSTLPLFSNQPVPNIVNGFVDGENVLVYVLLDDLSVNVPVSAFVGSSGQWSVDLSKIYRLERDESFEIGAETPLKILFYSNGGVKMIKGFKGALFEEQAVVNLDGHEKNIFSHIPNAAKFTEVLLFEEEEVIVKEEEVEEEVMGVEDEVVEIVVDTFEWSPLN